MGAELSCRIKRGVSYDSGKALLESDALFFSGEKSRVIVSFALSREAKVEGNWLSLQGYQFELGAVAQTWADKIRNPKSVLQKLGVKPGAQVALVGDFEKDFVTHLERTGAVSAKRGPFDVIFFEAATPKALTGLSEQKKKLKANGALWLIRPKGKDSPVPESLCRAAGLGAGLVDVKVVAFSGTHSAEKYVIPLAARMGA
jgi:hypothetical protein